MISFVIPFHNEEKNAKPNILRIINHSKKNKWIFEVIAVDDRSTDKTPVILDDLAKKYKEIKPLFRKKDFKEKGNTMGITLMEGTKKAKGDIVIWTMGDLADDPATFTKIVNKLNSGYQIVFGSRYMRGGNSGNLDKLKAFLSSSGTRLAGILFGIKVHDITNAFRGFKKSVLKKITLESSGFSISPEFAIKAHLIGVKLGEVPTKYSNRVEGVSSFKLFKMTRSYLVLYFKLFLKHKVLKKKVSLV